MGSVGTWHSENDRVVRLLAIDSVYAEKMRKQIVAETIGWVRDIYVFHTTGSLPDRTLVENLRRSALHLEGAKLPNQAVEGKVKAAGDISW